MLTYLETLTKTGAGAILPEFLLVRVELESLLLVRPNLKKKKRYKMKNNIEYYQEEAEFIRLKAISNFYLGKQIAIMRRIFLKNDLLSYTTSVNAVSM